MNCAASRTVTLLALFFLAACGGSSAGSDGLDGLSDGGSSDASGVDVDTALPPLFSLAEFQDPPPEYRPWVRWWWPGDDVDADELRRQVDVLADAYFGGAEIQAFDAALDKEAASDELARRRAVGSESWAAHVVAALDAADQRGLQLDLNLGSGWPPGGGGVSEGDSLKSLVHGEYPVDGPQRWSVEKLAPKQPPFYTVAAIAESSFGERMARWLPESATLLGVWALRVTGGNRDPSPLVLTDTVEVNPAATVDLTPFVDQTGGLAWDAPAGEWRVVPIFAMPDGEYVQLTAEDPDGYVVDLFDTAAVERNLTRWQELPEGFAAHFGGALHGFFTDSFELKAERLFGPAVLDEFEARRGYSLVPWLPALPFPAADNFMLEAGRVARAPEFHLGPDDERVRHDYAQTISELFVERYVETSSAWAESRGLANRIQAYGIDVDVLAAAAAASIPETEQLYAGGAEPFLKLASSGAHLAGHDIVAAESFVWPLRDFMTTPLKMKAAADKLLGCGVTRLVYHGFPYRFGVDPDGPYGEVGWSAFSSAFGGPNTWSSFFAEASPFWPFVDAVNRYVARLQYLLRQGEPSADVLVLYPWLGFPTSLALTGEHREPLLGGWLEEAEPSLEDDAQPFADLLGFFGEPVTDPRAAWVTTLWPRLQRLEARGWTWEWIGPTGLDALRWEKGELTNGHGHWRALLVYETMSLPPTAAERLLALAEAGAPIVLAGAQPSRQPGFGGSETGDARVADALVAVRAAQSCVESDGEEIEGTLTAAGTAPAVRFAAPADVRALTRRLPGGQLIFLRNPAGQPSAVTLAIPTDARPLRQLDAWTGESWELTGDTATLHLTLPAYGSAVLLTDRRLEEADLPPGPAPRAPAQAADDVALTPWSVTLAGLGSGGESESETFELAELVDWRQDERLRPRGAPVTYRTTFRLDTLPDHAAIRFDWVHGAARARLNGHDLGSLLLPPFRLNLSEGLVEGENVLEIEITPPLRNHFLALADAGDPRYARFADRQDTQVAAGLVGPAVLELE